MALSISLIGGLGRIARTAEAIDVAPTYVAPEPIYTEPVATVEPVYYAAQPDPGYVAPDPGYVAPEPTHVQLSPTTETAPTNSVFVAQPDPGYVAPTYQEQPVIAPTADYNTAVSTQDVYVRPTYESAIAVMPDPGYTAPTNDAQILQPVQPVASEPVVTVQPLPQPVTLPPLPTPPSLPPMPVPQPVEQPAAGPRIEPNVPAPVVPMLPAKSPFVMPAYGKWAIGLGLLAAIGYGVHRARKRRR